MREIKFRGLNRRNDRRWSGWHYGDLWVERSGVCVGSYEVDPVTVGQFTGLCDCEEQEIFEGDVLEFTVFDYQGQDTQYRGVVEWGGSRFIVSVCLVLAPKTWRKKRNYEESYYDLDWLLDQDDEAKIIGNVHDSPELLEAKDA